MRLLLVPIPGGRAARRLDRSGDGQHAHAEDVEYQPALGVDDVVTWTRHDVVYARVGSGPAEEVGHGDGGYGLFPYASFTSDGRPRVQWFTGLGSAPRLHTATG